MTRDLARLADERAWRAAQDAVRRAGHGQRQQARRKLRQVTHELLRRDVRAAMGGR